MAKGIYVGVGGIARKVNKEYVGLGGVARKVTKGYVGVGGIARECFSSGVPWKKYGCLKISDGYYEEWRNYSRTVTEEWSHASQRQFYETLEFTPENGYQTTDHIWYQAPETATLLSMQKTIVGLATYADGPYADIVIAVSNYVKDSGYSKRFWVDITYQTYEAEYYPPVFQKGVYYDTIWVPENQFPVGTLVDGAFSSDYCVLQDEYGTYYYYEKA